MVKTNKLSMRHTEGINVHLPGSVSNGNQQAQ